MSTSDTTTILGPGSAFEGKLTFEGTVRIDGEFSGEIHTRGPLIIGTGALVRAEVVAASVVVEGEIRGDIVASDNIEIRSPAKVYGNLSTPNLEIEKGSVFEGNCRMQLEESAVSKTGPQGAVPPEASGAEA